MIVPGFDLIGRGPDSLIFVEIFLGHVVLRDFMGADLPSLIVGGFDSGDDVGFEGVSFFYQFVNALRIGASHAG